ncbi:MAG: hypothetical protein GX352_09890 [Clostridiales bacterium]|nr:hypothetical protein [Clostridiales bacterium]
MNYLLERVAYLKGLAEGLGIKDNTNEEKVLVIMMDILEDIVHEIAELNESGVELDDYVQSIDEDLANVEDEIYGDLGDDEFFDDSQYIEVECPHCGEITYFADEEFDGENDLLCPNCDRSIYEVEDIDIPEE